MKLGSLQFFFSLMEEKKNNKDELLLLPPTYNPKYKLEYSVHKCSKLLYKDLLRIFSTEKYRLQSIEDVLIVPTFQQSSVEMIATRGEADTEKDRLLENVCKSFQTLHNIKTEYFSECYTECC
jgi:hypothetical protein